MIAIAGLLDRAFDGGGNSLIPGLAGRGGAGSYSSPGRSFIRVATVPSDPKIAALRPHRRRDS